nr:family 10 glycosylhydrolase [Eubacterium sp.]
MKIRMYMILSLVLMAVASCFIGKELEAADTEVRAVWVSFFEYETAGLKDKSEEEFRANADIMFKNIRNNGCNTVYFHVRAFDDAIWPSDNFEFSSYMGEYEPDYDPLAILVESAHKYQLSFHAWMNPYRITQKKIYNPSKESTRSRILLAVKEVIDSYAVDGIHFDDYFYPSSSHKQYKKYKSVSKEEKMTYVNTMIQEVYNMVKQKSPTLQFGISPAGNVENCEAMGADVKTWMSVPGYIDYIVPQIYWSNNYLLEGKRTKLFDKRLKQWTKLNTAGVQMYVGLGLYRGGMSDRYDRGWKKSSKVIANEIGKIRKNAKVSGYSLFSYESLYKESCRKEVKNMLSKISSVTITGGKNTLTKGDKLRLKASVWPLRLGQTVTWRTSNKRIATVSKKGVVKAKKKGTVKIYAKKGTKKAVLRIKIIS